MGLFAFRQGGVEQPPQRSQTSCSLIDTNIDRCEGVREDGLKLGRGEHSDE